MKWIAETVTKALSSADKPGESALTLPVTTPQQATAFALVYGLPLLSYSNLASQIQKHKGEFVTNDFYHQKHLATAAFTDINRPNVDTLYSEALVDLSTNDLVLTIPDVPTGRFYVFPLYDAYGNNFANIGTNGFSKTAGDYLLSYRPAHPGHGSGDDTYAGYIYSPTPYAAIDLRIQVNGTDDVPAVNALQVQFILTLGPAHFQIAPKLTASILLDNLPTDYTEKVLQLTARLSVFNLPEVGSDIAWVTATLRTAGLSRGSYTTPSGVDLAAALAAAVKGIASVRQGDAYFRQLNNNWSQLRDIYSGDFKSHYLVRAFVAAYGYLQLTADQAIYPVYNVSSSLTSDQSYTVTFSKKPPVTGFWSLTVYNDESYLVPNRWNVYALGDRSAIEYPDGSLVYPSDTDGEFVLLLQTKDSPPAEKYQPNWIPTTASGEKFNFNLRWYGPTAELLDGTYIYPVVAPVATV